jgi:hypothetical protein
LALLRHGIASIAAALSLPRHVGRVMRLRWRGQLAWWPDKRDRHEGWPPISTKIRPATMLLLVVQLVLLRLNRVDRRRTDQDDGSK